MTRINLAYEKLIVVFSAKFSSFLKMSKYLFVNQLESVFLDFT